MTEQAWIQVAQKLLVGRTIKAVDYMTADEADQCGWSARPIMITLDDGTVIYPSRDDEGNDGGALFTNDEGTSVIPVI